jgi:hypothetical protein
MKMLIAVFILFLLCCNNSGLEEYVNMDIPKTSLGVYIVGNIIVKDRKIFQEGKEVDATLAGNVSEILKNLLISEIKARCKFGNVSYFICDSLAMLHKRSNQTSLNEDSLIFLPDSGTNLCYWKTAHFDFVLILQKIEVTHYIGTYSGFGSAAYTEKQDCINQKAYFTLWDNNEKKIILNDNISAGDCATFDNNKIGNDYYTQAITRFVIRIFDDTPFIFKIMGARDFR